MMGTRGLRGEGGREGSVGIGFVQWRGERSRKDEEGSPRGEALRGEFDG